MGLPLTYQSLLTTNCLLDLARDLSLLCVITTLQLSLLFLLLSFRTEFTELIESSGFMTQKGTSFDL